MVEIIDYELYKVVNAMQLWNNLTKERFGIFV